jgi:hypothetical protein
MISGAVDGLAGKRARQSDTLIEALSKNLARAAANAAGREIVRGLMGSLFGGTRRGR